MSTVAETGASFRVLDAAGKTLYSASVGKQSGSWSNSPALTYLVYTLDFTVPEAPHYSITVSGPVNAKSPVFAVACPETLYSGLLLNSKFFYETERDGPDYIQNSLRSAPGHLNDSRAAVYTTPPLDADDNIATTRTALHPTGVA